MRLHAQARGTGLGDDEVGLPAVRLFDPRLSSHSPGRLTVFSAVSGDRLGQAELGLFPLTITSSPDGALGYVSRVTSSTVDPIDLESMQRLNRLEIAKQGEPGAYGLHPPGHTEPRPPA